jgi:Transcriptional regulator
MKVPVVSHAAAHTPRTGRGTRLTGEERRSKIIEVSISLFSRHGYNGTTTKALADAAAISEATIFKYFRSKNALHCAAFQHRTESDIEQLISEFKRMADAGDDRCLLRTLFLSVCAGYTRDRDLHRMMLFALLEGDAEKIRRIADELAGSLSDFVGSWIARRQEEGVFAPGPLSVLAPALLAPIVASLTWSKLYGVDCGLDDATEVDVLVPVILRGLRRPDRPDADNRP